jgi:hypothetical protein
MSIKNALNHIMNGNLDAMRSELSAEMTSKAMDRLEEKKLDIANSYFGKK